mgnify:CR=1 FL=1
MSTIILTGGGTAGHCSPHVALLPHLTKHFDNIYYIGSENGIEREILAKTNIPYYYTSCAKLKRNKFFSNITIPFKLIKGINEAKKLIKSLKPDVIFSKGGFVSVPTVIAGHKLGIPIIAHESDYTIGLANKITSKYCLKVLTAFPETAKSLSNGEYVGMPLKPINSNINKAKIYQQFGFTGKRPVLLVTGGSLGAKAINDAVRNSLDTLLNVYDVLHICGKNNLDKKINKIGYYQVEFLSNILDAYSITSICVMRAGASTLFEVMNNKIPAVLIPLPKGASRGDQILNAKYFNALGLANILYQENLSPSSLVVAVNSAYSNRFELQKNFEKNNVKSANEKIVNILTKFALKS